MIILAAKNTHTIVTYFSSCSFHCCSLQHQSASDMCRQGNSIDYIQTILTCCSISSFATVQKVECYICIIKLQIPIAIWWYGQEETRQSSKGGSLHTYGIFFSTKQCALNFKECNLVFVSSSHMLGPPLKCIDLTKIQCGLELESWRRAKDIENIENETNDVFLSTKKMCTLFKKKCNFVFVS